MVKMKIFQIICLIIFLTLQHSLLLGNNSLFTYIGLTKTLNKSMLELNNLSQKNIKLKSNIQEIESDKEFLEMYARENFGYIKKYETFYQILKNED
ncbi:MAG: hypothetical protein CMD43_00205 [Gammaproteobacteria bacterium]|nr:hypothetical protein [Gammaproteobacteria bacterium]|tara:strand:- start:995 stop:1282 length:288 start_codon:yes stop_codon:yes gene_type:complete